MSHATFILPNTEACTVVCIGAKIQQQWCMNYHSGAIIQYGKDCHIVGHILSYRSIQSMSNSKTLRGRYCHTVAQYSPRWSTVWCPWAVVHVPVEGGVPAGRRGGRLVRLQRARRPQRPAPPVHAAEGARAERAHQRLYSEKQTGSMQWTSNFVYNIRRQLFSCSNKIRKQY